MEIKRVHIAYFSPTGTTKRTLRAVAEGFGCSELSETDWGDPKSRAAILKTGPDELVIAGMPVYYGRIPSLFHEGLPLHGEGTFVPVAVYGNRHYDDAVLELKRSARRRVRDARCRAFVAQHCLIPIWAVAPRRFRSRGHEAFRQCSAGQGGWPCRFHAASGVRGCPVQGVQTDAVRARVAGRRNLYPLRPVRPDVPGSDH
ncbi:MAG: flavodoxin family protein [Bilophila wadsworthia]